MKQTFEIPEGCTRVTIEQHDNQIITTFEPEIKFNEGDILVKTYAPHIAYIFILDKISKDNVIYYKGYFSPYYGSIEIEKDFGIGRIDDSMHKEIRIATESEKQQLFDALAKVGKKWNAEKKCIEELKHERWRAKIYEPYYVLDGCFEVFESEENNYNIDNKRYNIGNYFQTEQQAKDFAEKIKQLPR